MPIEPAEERDLGTFEVSPGVSIQFANHHPKLDSISVEDAGGRVIDTRRSIGMTARLRLRPGRYVARALDTESGELACTDFVVADAPLTVTLEP